MTGEEADNGTVKNLYCSSFYSSGNTYRKVGEKLDALEGEVELDEDYLEELDGGEVEEDEVMQENVSDTLGTRAKKTKRRPDMQLRWSRRI